jgi:transposase
VYQDMSMWSEIRRRVLAEKTSKRAICREYQIHWDTLEKILQHEEPPGYRRKRPRARPVLGPFLPIVHEILEQDRQAPKKQRHTAKRIFDRLRTEHGYQGGETVVKDAVRAWRQGQAEVFVPLSHPPAHAQMDYGEATVRIGGEPVKAAFFVMTLLYSDALFCQVFPRECTETFQEGHRRAFAFFGGVPKRISYDNSKIAVAKVVGRRGQTPTREFLRLESHYLFDHHFCLVRRANERGTSRTCWASRGGTSWFRCRKRTAWRRSTPSW